MHQLHIATSISSGLGQNASYHALIGLVEYALKREFQAIYMKIVRNCNSNPIVGLEFWKLKGQEPNNQASTVVNPLA